MNEPDAADPADVPNAPEASGAPPAADKAEAAPATPLDPRLEAFVDVCTRLQGFESHLEPEWIDGYLTALAASWRDYEPDDWLPRLCGDAFGRTFADPPDEAAARRALNGRYLLLRGLLEPEALLDRPDDLVLAPFMLEWTDEDRARVLNETAATAEEAQSLQTGAAWSDGFFRAVADFEADWPSPAPDDPDRAAFEQMLLGVMALALPPEAPLLQEWRRKVWPDKTPTRDDLIDEALMCAQELRIWWLDHHPRTPPRRAAALPGRNEPCWCGSGKKFKKCHGAAA